MTFYSKAANRNQQLKSADFGRGWLHNFEAAICASRYVQADPNRRLPVTTSCQIPLMTNTAADNEARAGCVGFLSRDEMM
jgi:hypothetical protein